MREKIIEQQLVQAVKHKGGICPKFVSPGYDGMPDRLVLLPHGHIAFVEQVKSDGSILISESNVKGLGIVSYRTFDAETAKQFTYVIGK